MIYPVILRSLTAGIAAGARVPNSDARALHNPTDRVMRIREIRFSPIINSAPGYVQMDSTFLALVQVQLRFGNNPITAQFMPLAQFVEPLDLSYEMNGSEGSIGTAFTLFLRQPVLLAPGETITYAVFNGSAQILDLRVTAILEEPSAGVKGVTPWIAGWTSPTHTDGTGDFEDSSSESDLVNPFPRPMFVERMIGRFIWADQSAMAGPAYPGVLTLPFNQIRVRIDDHRGRQIIRDPTPFGCAFDATKRGWEVNCMLDSKGFYRVSVDSKLTTQVVTGLDPQTIRCMIGMLGYHDARE